MGRQGGTWQKEQAGWLKNPLRRERRFKPLSLIDSEVLALMKQIRDFEGYTKLREKADALVKLRDEASVAIAWTFIKRGGEYMRLKLKDVYADESEVAVMYVIEKKVKRRKVCPSCGEKNKLKSKFCSDCSHDVSAIEPSVFQAPSPRIVTKRKTAAYAFCGPFMAWCRKVKELDGRPEAYLFPPMIAASQTFNFDKHISLTRFDQIIQRLDPSITSHMFRYGHTEVLLKLGYKKSEVKDAGDWEREDMVDTYAKRKGLTEEAQKFSRDERMLGQ